MICLSSGLLLFCQANVPTDEVQDVRPGPQGQVHPPPGHCGRGRLPLQVPQQVKERCHKEEILILKAGSL